MAVMSALKNKVKTGKTASKKAAPAKEEAKKEGA